MGGDDVAILSVIFGSVIAIVFITTVGSIIKAAIKRKSSSSVADNKEFLAALREFKEKTDRRLQNLEAIVSGDEPMPSKTTKKEEKKTERKSAIEIEIEDQQKKEDNNQSNSGKLKNMLNQ
ncbi:hypothetical protein [Rhodohalobacter barkolensis]|uniref:Uncharacterized protein n=1 Tax=Rhodohalobacter barkolensis TaxID=2053187 RepID=A0A2N0VET0_9BACT|nr:hypothetical protein [Rhodohalobacter barkolensis]PKD42670.1 hypothetical protein CWD77_14790 [Rhodohalobacter barkolensis]